LLHQILDVRTYILLYTVECTCGKFCVIQQPF
jgi:hypothetical protein